MATEIEHRAYSFDHDGFVAELAPVLQRALETNDAAPVLAFIRSDTARLRSPFGGGPLGSRWEDDLINRDAQEYGLFALTAYYDPAENIGLADLWEPVVEDAHAELDADADRLVLGRPFGPAENRFNPGRYGSYFRSADEVRTDLATVDAALAAETRSETIDVLQGMLRRAVDAGRGLYVTF